MPRINSDAGYGWQKLRLGTKPLILVGLSPAEGGRFAAPLRVAPSGVSRLAGRKVKVRPVHALAGWQARALGLPSGWGDPEVLYAQATE